MLKRLLILILFSWCVSNAYGQQYVLDLDATDNKFVNQWMHSQPGTQDSIVWILERNKLFLLLHEQGYMLADLSIWQFRNDTLHVAIDPGNQIHWAKITFKGLEFLPPQWVQNLDLSGSLVNYRNWNTSVSETLNAAQREGYLFADYKLVVLGLQHDSLQAEIQFNPGLKFILDSIEIEGNAKLSTPYLEKIVNLKQGQPLTPDFIYELEQQIDNLRFLQQVKPPALVLDGQKATIRLFLKNRNASSFDFLLGLQPSSSLNPKVSLNGYVKLDLVNQLLHGERIFLNLEKLRPRSQRLDLALGYPYLFDLPFGVEGNFNLVKNDTLYSELAWKAGIVFPFGKSQFVRAGITQYASSIISLDQNQVLTTRKLPAYIDLRIKGFELGLERNRLDYPINPRKGYEVLCNAVFSQKKVLPNSVISNLNKIDPGFDYNSLYDSITQNVSRISFVIRGQYFIPWGTRSTIRFAVDAGILESDKSLFLSELFRLGGYARLRGFEEESILVQHYSIFTVEYRLVIGGAGYVSFFSDYAFVNSIRVEDPYTDHPYSIGIGLNIETKGGIFHMRAAVGNQKGSGFDFNATRIHLGYTNHF